MNDSERDLISVIVPVYNVEPFLDRCMQSILRQTYRNLEIILVDDGSTDASAQLCDDYARKDGRVKVLHKTNGGLSDARNAGLELASGAYIGYVDSDDWIEPDMYEQMHRACVENNARIAVCRYFNEYRDRTESGGSGSVVPLSREELLKIYIGGHDSYIIYNSVWSKLFARELVQGMVFPKGRNSEDILYTTRAFCKADRAVYLDSSFYHYVIDREGSIMNAAGAERMFRDEIPFWRAHIACISEMVAVESRNRETAARLVTEIKKDRDETDRVYGSKIVSKGDRMRLRLFLLSPPLYAGVVRLYEKVVIPLRNGKG